MATELKQSTNRNVMVLMIDSTDHITGKTGLTLTITASKDTGSYATITPTVTERGNGRYALALTTAHTDTLGEFNLGVTATGADPYDEKFVVVKDLSGESVASVTGNVAGNVVGSVATVTGAVGSVAGDVQGNVNGTVVQPVALTTGAVAAIWRFASLIESYAADGAVPTPEQALFMLLAMFMEVSKSGGTITVLKLDGATPAMTFTLNDPIAPTAITRAS